MSGDGGTLSGMSIEGVLRQQAGVITRAQALAAGLSTHQVDRRLSSKRWLRILPQVYLAAEHELSVEAELRAATLWGGPTATISGVAAAWWHELWSEPPDVIELTVARHEYLVSRGNIRVRRRELSRRDRVCRRQLWVTDAPLTVLEAAVALGERGVMLLDRALQRRVHFNSVHAAHSRNLGRRGSAAAGALLAAAADRAASEAERKTIALLRGAGITGWRLGYVVAGYAVDIAFPAKRVAIEIDGWAWHSDAQRFRQDRQRQNALVLAGWTVLRFTWYDLVHRAAHVVAQIRDALGDM